MNIRYIRYGCDSAASIDKFVYDQLSDTEGGRLERYFNELVNTKQALARLLEKMANDGKLTAPELYYIATGFNNREAKFGG